MRAPYRGGVTAPAIPALLSSLLAADAGRPLVTFYDDATGERVELSVKSFANWVAKTANLIRDGLCADPGELLAISLPTHWQGAVWLCGAWSCGLVVTFDEAALPEADYAVVGPDDALTAERPPSSTAAVSLRPMGAGLAAPPTAGVLDFAAEVLGYPDDFAPDGVTPTTPALQTPEGVWTQEQLVRHGTAVAGGLALGAAPRLLTDANPCSSEGCGIALLAPLVTGGGVVLVRHLDPARVDARAAQERVTVRAVGAASRPR
jgi:uncharacterized protein (TIGR03089 family)